MSRSHPLPTLLLAALLAPLPASLPASAQQGLRLKPGEKVQAEKAARTPAAPVIACPSVANYRMLMQAGPPPPPRRWPTRRPTISAAPPCRATGSAPWSTR